MAGGVFLDWLDADHAVSVWRDGTSVNTGHGQDRAAALLDLWTSLEDTGETELAAWVARKYRAMTGQDAVR
jgi:hypothetical protein